MTEVPTILFDLGHVVGAVHQIIEIDHARRGHGGERNGGLAVMHGGGGQYTTDWDLAVGSIDVKLVALPTLLKALCVAFAADIAVCGQIDQHCRQAHAADLTFDPPQGCGRSNLAPAGAATPEFGGQRRLWFGRRLLARLNGGAVARDMADQPIAVCRLDQRFMQPTAARSWRSRQTRAKRWLRSAARPAAASHTDDAASCRHPASQSA